MQHKNNFHLCNFIINIVEIIARKFTFFEDPLIYVLIDFNSKR